MERNGDWMQTFTGRQFWPIDPYPSEISIEDIAHSLAMQCRFAGHCLRFYSVAEHSVLVSRALPPHLKLWGLLHDAAEAYVLDVVRPLKPFLPGYREIEDRVMVAICAHFCLDLDPMTSPPAMPSEVKLVDNRILLSERDQNMLPTSHVWGLAQAAAGAGFGPLDVTLQFWSPYEAERQFLAEFADISDLGISAIEAERAMK
jgi:hypothetical protein